MCGLEAQVFRYWNVVDLDDMVAAILKTCTKNRRAFDFGGAEKPVHNSTTMDLLARLQHEI